MSEALSPDIVEPVPTSTEPLHLREPIGAFPDTIYERMGQILAALPAIGKGQRNTQQNFAYRGHDDVMNELNPLLSKYGVFFVPHVLERITSERKTAKGNVLYEVNLLVQYTFYGPRGDSVVASAWGEGTDSGDKSTNKAMTMALKNVLAQSFAVSTEENAKYDTDASSDEETTGRRGAYEQPQAGADVPQTWAQVEELVMHFGFDVWKVFQGFLRAAQAHEPRFRAKNTSAFRQAAAGVAVALRERFEPSELPGPGVEDLRQLWSAAVGGVLLDPLYETEAPAEEAAGDAVEAVTATPEGTTEGEA